MQFLDVTKPGRTSMFWPAVRREKSCKESLIKSRRWELGETMSGRNIHLLEKGSSLKKWCMQ